MVSNSICRVCGSADGYQENVMVTYANGKQYETVVNYCCKICGVCFVDPARFCDPETGRQGDE